MITKVAIPEVLLERILYKLAEKVIEKDPFIMEIKSSVEKIPEASKDFTLVTPEVAS